MSTLTPPPAVDDGHLAALRQDVRSFLDQQRAVGAFTPTVDTWLSGWDVGFTRALAEQGWLSMTIPREYGGHGRSLRSHPDRLWDVVLGAPSRIEATA